jgi:hypothetical protein
MQIKAQKDAIALSTKKTLELEGKFSPFPYA